MKKVAFIFVLLLTIIASGQTVNKTQSVEGNDLIKVKYFHDNGALSQEGFFNKKGLLDGVWKSYDENGKKLCVGTYNNGVKVGKWMFWQKNILKEVDFVDNAIVNIKSWKEDYTLAIK